MPDQTAFGLDSHSSWFSLHCSNSNSTTFSIAFSTTSPPIEYQTQFTMDPQAQLELSKLSDADKRELNQILTSEAQKSSIQQSECYLNLSATCFWDWT